MASLNVFRYCVILCFILIHLNTAFCLSDQGKWSFTFNEKKYYQTVSKSLYKDSKVQIKAICDNDGSSISHLKIGWVIRQAPCYNEYLDSEIMDEESLPFYYKCPYAELSLDTPYKMVRYLKSSEDIYECSHHIQLPTINRPFEVKKTKETTSIARECQKMPDRFIGKENSLKSEPESDMKVDAPEMLPKPVEVVQPKRPARAAQLPDATITSSQKNTSTQSTSTLSEPSKSEHKQMTIPIENTNSSTKNGSVSLKSGATAPNYEAVVDQDGLFFLILYIRGTDSGVEYNVTVDIEMKGNQGYLSAVNWPLLPFYGVMCAIYVIYAVVWLVISALQWRNLLRIQFWIGGLIFLGLVEKAVFYGEYQFVNSTGQSIHGAILFAEVLSCVKRTVARLLVIIVSLGFGIVKPRLGSVLHRIVGVGTLYLVLCVIEGCLRVLKPKNVLSNQTLMAEIPLAVLDSAICWWIFSSLVQTTRTLRLRRNVVKLTLYQHFTNTLIFAVLASIVYMSWSLYNHKLTNCITDWHELWVDEAYWHFLFSLVLMVIMILWRPTNNNQRYAFTPLLDAVDDEDDDFTATNDAFGIQSRNAKNQSNTSSKKREHRNSQTEDDLKWVEENIPSSFTDTALPSLLDSDEEIMTVRFERNKME